MGEKFITKDYWAEASTAKNYGTEKFIVKDNWAEKYIKDNIWYPFGTIVNGWVTIMKDRPEYTIEQYKEDIKILYNLAIEVSVSTYKISERLEIGKEKGKYVQPDIPIVSTGHIP